MIENVIEAKIISVKQDKMLPSDGMSVVTNVKSESQQSIFINFLNSYLTGKFLEEFQIKIK